MINEPVIAMLAWKIRTGQRSRILSDTHAIAMLQMIETTVGVVDHIERPIPASDNKDATGKQSSFEHPQKSSRTGQAAQAPYEADNKDTEAPSSDLEAEPNACTYSTYPSF